MLNELAVTFDGYSLGFINNNLIFGYYDEFFNFIVVISDTLNKDNLQEAWDFLYSWYSNGEIVPIF